MSTLDEVSRAIGRMEALLIEQGKDISKIQETVAPLLPLVQRVDAIEPHVEDYKRNKNRLLGIVAGLSAAGGGAAGWISKMFSGGSS